MDNTRVNQLRNEILDKVSEFYKATKDAEPKYRVGDRIPYASRVYDQHEMLNLIDSSLDFWLTAGKYTIQFESKFAEYLDVKYTTLVNTGSNANLLAFMALTSPLLGDRAICRGDEVITVAAGFPTTVAPILQFGAVPVFVDITIPEYNIDTKMLETALSRKTKAVVLAHTLGNPFDLEAVKSFCDDNDLWLIEDNCDALGTQYNINGKDKFTGTIGDIGTSSFYPPHHMTMGEGGAVYTNDSLLNKIIVSMRDWGRDCVCPPGKDNICKHRFDRQDGLLPEGYDHKYVYSHFGYNFKATDMQAALGCAQLEKLPLFTQKRKENFDVLYNELKDLIPKMILPEPQKKSKPSWFGFMLTCGKDISCNEITNYLEMNGIQTRKLFAGNIIKHPCFDKIRDDESVYRVVGTLKNTDRIMKDAFWIGVYPGLSHEMLEYMITNIKDAIN